ncbi:uncharacterized protein EDB91DRAFT_1099114 [Suillus paluster]|uniref:uncharacterized protein n=1 Tax=Suillus paluster TaxID=48578 RepID=UPI001B873FCE|nr:uncharacterized protein EDB91DRAFT_1099114 [Suillus paluster]KAG1753649.1 hypothetical protein EDB91DRAFT_1099114 [Suillus paluster]
MRRSSCSSASAENVTTLQVESVSAPMDVDDAGASASASGTGTISEPAQTFVTTLGMDSIAPEKRVRPLSWKAKQINTQKAQKPERIGKPNSRRPQKRKSKSLATQDEAQMCQWPARPEQEGSFQWQFVQCDNCDLWYHFGCVGIGEGDPRLEPESVFICPPCWYVSIVDSYLLRSMNGLELFSVLSAKRQTMRKRDGTCARPDCSHTQLEPEEFIIERLVGRKTIGAAGYLFLVKWEGYAIAQASWIPEGSIVGASKIFDRFVTDATAEGIGLNAKGVILLEEARDGGWSV